MFWYGKHVCLLSFCTNSTDAVHCEKRNKTMGRTAAVIPGGWAIHRDWSSIWQKNIYSAYCLWRRRNPMIWKQLSRGFLKKLLPCYSEGAFRWLGLKFCYPSKALNGMEKVHIFVSIYFMYTLQYLNSLTSCFWICKIGTLIAPTSKNNIADSVKQFCAYVQWVINVCQQLLSCVFSVI